MSSNGELYLLLGCFGRNDDGFISCPSCENRILKVATNLEYYNQIMDYFEACRLFDRPMFEYSAIAHFIRNMQDKFDQVAALKRLWTEKQYHLFQKFIADHRLCGLYVRLALILPEDEQIIHPDKGIIIKSETINTDNAKFKLSLIRGRR